MDTYLETLVVLVLLLVYDTQTEVDLVGLFELGGHTHDLRKGLLGMIQRAVAIVQNTNTVPQLGFLQEINNQQLMRSDNANPKLLTLGSRR